MKIKTIRIKNFRSFKDCEIEFEDFTSLVGSNGAGKSTVLYALNIFFREIEGSATNVIELDEEDFHNRNTENPIEITVTFDELSPEALAVFSDYARQGILVVTAKATFNPDTRTATVRQFGQRLVMEAFKEFFEMYGDKKPADELKAEYERLRTAFSDLPIARSRDAYRDALRAYETAYPENCVLIPSEDQFYGVTRGSNRLAQFIQWVYLPAVKDASKEREEGRNTAFGKLVARTVRTKVNFEAEIATIQNEAIKKYNDLVKSRKTILDDISKTLTKKIIEWAHPEAKARIAWKEDDKRSVQIEDPIAYLIAGDGEFEGDISRFGHGFQRSYLLALLQELADVNDANAPKLILGCEEPELYQHPPQARHLAHVLQALSQQNSQVIVATHSPYFVTGRHFESVRLVRKMSNCSTVASVKSKRISQRLAEVTGEAEVPFKAQIALLHQALQPNLSEMFFAPKIVLVEGLEDVAYITSWLVLSDKWDAFRRSRCHLIQVQGKSNLKTPLIIAQEIGIPVFVVFDADLKPERKPEEQDFHSKDNKHLLSLLGLDPSHPFPQDTLWGTHYIVWSTNLGDTLKAEVETARQGDWDRTYTQATGMLGLTGGDRTYNKNTIHIGDHLALLKAANIDIPSLTRLCDMIVSF